jgi:putative membrane protein
MDRRLVLLGLTGAAAPLLLHNATAAAQSLSPNGSSPLDPASYAAQTLQIGTLAKTTSQIALKNSGNAYVRRFANLEIAEQTAVAQSLTSNFDPPPAELTADQQQIVASLQGQSSLAFDAAYVQAQIQGHRQLLNIQQEFLAGETDPTADFVHIALIATPFIQTHLSILRGLQIIAP